MIGSGFCLCEKRSEEKPVKYRTIKENHLFQKTYAKGKRAVGRYAAVYVLTDYHAQKLRKAHPLKITVNRMGFAVSKKTGGAVLRNRVRRVLREAYRQLEAEYVIKTGFLVVLAARDAAADAKTPAVKQDVKRSLQKLGILSLPRS